MYLRHGFSFNGFFSLTIEKRVVAFCPCWPQRVFLIVSLVSPASESVGVLTSGAIGVLEQSSHQHHEFLFKVSAERGKHLWKAGVCAGSELPAEISVLMTWVISSHSCLSGHLRADAGLGTESQRGPGQPSNFTLGRLETICVSLALPGRPQGDRS